ncbi:MAG: methyltransferase domain-containing protein [Parvibaculaceae bacterium]
MRAWAVPLGNMVTRHQGTILPLLVLGAYALAAPSPTAFGSEALEPLRDLLGVAVALLGLALRAWSALRRERRGPGHIALECGSNLLVVLGILLVHGNSYVLAVGLLLGAFFLFVSLQAEEAHAPRSGRRTVLNRMAARLFPRDRSAGSLWITGAATAIVLLLTEVYERLPAGDAHLVRLVLLFLIVLLLIDALLVLRRTTAPAPASWAPDASAVRTRGILVSGRSGSVDVLENALSLGNRDAILEATLKAAELRPGARLLDIGCGTGRLAIRAAGLFRNQPGVEAFGIDATPEMVALARRRAAEEGSSARFEVGIGEALPFEDGSLDAVTSSYFFHHLPPEAKREALAEMLRVAKPGGRIVITDYGRPRGFLGLLASFPMRFNFYEYTRPQLKGELEAIVREQGFEPEILRRFLGYITVMRVRKPG